MSVGFGILANIERKKVNNEPRRIQGTRPCYPPAGNNVSRVCYNQLNKKGRWQLMLISTALEGKYYKSRSFARKGLDGIIQYAERYSLLETSESEFCYKVNVRPQWNGTGFPKPDFWATIFVGVDRE
jgi:hypothetical protein